jgi:hypothetical protein
MIYEYSLSTPRENLYNITPQVCEAVNKSGLIDKTRQKLGVPIEEAGGSYDSL